jgi:cytosine/adenosine deaminase-related metal-dependent hydrolase
MKVIINARIYDYVNYIECGYVLFDKQIIKVGPMSQYKPSSDVEVIDFEGDLLIPGFVCNHAHIYSIFARGLALPFNPKNFQEILDQMWWKLDSKLTNELTYYSGIAASYEFLLNGVTTVIDHHASGEIIGSLTNLSKAVSGVANMRGLYCFETSDRYNVDECLKENISFAKENKTDKVRGLFGMHASMSLSDETLMKISKENKDIPLHVHVAESKMDEDDSYSRSGVNIIERFNKFNLIKPHSLIVHGVHLSENELKLLKDKDVVMVVNTTSNMNNAVGLPCVKSYLDNGLPVMVGNDGLSSNMASEYMNVLYTSHLINEEPTKLNLGDVLNMIKTSYKYISDTFGIKLGEIKEGYEADLLRVKYTPFTKMDASNAFGHLFYGTFPNFKPRDVLIGGDYQVKNYKVVNEKLVGEFNKCTKYSQRLWETLKEEK